MHGRVKVRTTEEERERKKKEQALKVKAYRAAMAIVQGKRQRQEYDDEMLQVTTEVLKRNPDINTLWNVRRQAIARKAEELRKKPDTIKDTPEPEDSEDGAKAESNSLEALRKIYDNELYLAEQCLLANPKSYGAWHHRIWTLENCPEPNWQREVELCNKYLKLDERNFHTWDYRRYVTAKAGISKAAELDFCTEKIKLNFSNYSSWHHRSLLLPQLYPYEGEAQPRRPMSEAKLKQELEMVLTAAFTDPNDSSAWFYQRWLLGYSRAELDLCVFRVDKDKAVMGLTQAAPMDNAKVFIEDENGQQILDLHEWRSVSGSKADTTWWTPLAKENPLKFDCQHQYHLRSNIPLMEVTSRTQPLRFHESSFYSFNPPNRSFAFSAAVLEELQTQLESCNDLLEYEPDSKWTLLTAALLMRAIDREQFHSKTLEYLEKLQQVDELRVGYYKDLASKWVLEKLLSDWSASEEIPKKLTLVGEKRLSSISFPQYLSIVDELELPEELSRRYSDTRRLKTFKDFA